jgi:hypothetical protein
MDTDVDRSANGRIFIDVCSINTKNLSNRIIFKSKKKKQIGNT